ncbi:cytochrome and DOMON domain-containing protein [Aspergillus melleus]|uniref:cytochrome and DOMON domain-containing protein n=1 Tax=Aspergillus melleus TaxID=138277 RepID=UPI001E8D517A|nr:uncharacterized protein LDX57_005931 [Aspergillus melleus]KAH8428228.1 hypothetical protein LDX57_005931 [Aspergillus melleus]
MARSPISRLLLICLAIICHLSTIHAKPVQYCKFGYDKNPRDAEVDFCMGVTMHQNRSSDAYDMYLSMTVTRDSDLGWTAIGTGPVMAGSLMVIVYGDPNSKEAPTVSVRTVEGHRQPKLLTNETAGGTDIRILNASWQPVSHDDSPSSSPTFLAKIALVCYSCTSWPGIGDHPISATATSLPWLWAWNDNMQFANFSSDVHLKMHKHHSRDGGWGNFYVDMSRSVDTAEKPPSPPSIQPGVRTIGTTDKSSTAFKWPRLGPVAQAHGWLMGLTFLLFFPGGVIAMRSQSSRAFQYHWVIQLVASLCVAVGAILGIVMSHTFGSPHQIAGLVVSLTLGIQGVLGWRHHMAFLRIKRRTWISHTHIWAGRLILVVGWLNVISGMLLAGFGWFWVLLMSVVLVGVAVGLIFWVRASTKRKQRKGREGYDESEDALMPWKADQEGEYFVLGDEEEEEFLPDDVELSDMGDPGNARNRSGPYEPILRKGEES